MRSRKLLFIVIIIVVNIFSPFSVIVEFRYDGTLRRTCTGNGHEVSACRGLVGWCEGGRTGIGGRRVVGDGEGGP